MNNGMQRTARFATAVLAAGTALGTVALSPAGATPAPRPAASAPPLAPSVTQAVTINFNNVPRTGNLMLTHLSTAGYNFDGNFFNTVDSPGICNFGGCVFNGTIYIAEEGGGLGQPFTMTRGTGGTFRLAKLSLGQLFNDDAAAANAGFPNATAVTLTGTLSSGVQLMATFPPPDIGFASFTLPTNWKHVVSVRFSANGAFAADNIKIIQAL